MAEVVATDLSPIQPTWIPPNLQFLVDDCESDWTFERKSFDFIHIGHLVRKIPSVPDPAMSINLASIGCGPET